MRKLISLQYLRGLAACAVVLFHAAAKEGVDIRVGEAGVDVFFVLSGFLMICISGPRTSPVSFLADRLRRIAPVYWIATTTVLLGGLLGLFPNMRLGLWHTISSYMFIPARPPTGGPIWPLLVPGWTLNYEMMFYVVFAALLPLRAELRLLVVLTTIFAGLCCAGWIWAPRGALARFYTDPIILEFVAGAWIGWFWTRPWAWPRLVGWPMIGTAAALFILSAMGDDHRRVLSYGLPALMLLAGCLGLERRDRVIRLKTPERIGDASYSIYLWHTLAISLFAKIQHGLHIPPAVAILGDATAGGSVGIAAYYALERPIQKRLRRRRSADRPPQTQSDIVPAGGH